MLQTYRRQPVTFVRGEGVRLYDADGREYLDLLSGIGVASLGHAHPGLARAIAEQAQTLIHTSNLFYHPLQGQLAERLANLSGLPRAFFCNSGTEAVEACLKFARRYWYTQGRAARRSSSRSTSRSTAGRSASLSVTSDEHYRDAVRAAAAGGASSCRPTTRRRSRRRCRRTTAAIIAEPIQGEGGVRPLTPAFAAAINEACAKTGALFIADEVQSGLGRTGYPFYFAGARPEAAPGRRSARRSAAACRSARRSSARRSPTRSRSAITARTYGGNLLACRAALASSTSWSAAACSAHVGRVGAHFEQRLRAIAAKHPIVKEVRGAGLMWGLELTRDAAPVVPAGARARASSSTARRRRSSGCCRRSSSPRPRSTRRSIVSMRRSAPWELANEQTDPRPHHAAHGGRVGREEAARADSGEPRGRASAAAHARRADASTPTASSSRSRRARSSAAPSWRRSARTSPKSARSPSTRRRAAAGVGVDDRRRAAAARAARGLREAVRVHARARLLHSHGLLDRAAPLAAREDLHRLREVPAVPAVRPVRDGRAARRGVRRRARLRTAGGRPPSA